MNKNTQELTDAVVAHNSCSWDQESSERGPWSTEVSPELIKRAAAGDWEIRLAGSTPVPRPWFPEKLQGCRTLLLAGAGGQQAPTLAAAGADVTVLDNSPQQLAKDRLVAERDSLSVATMLGDMQDLSMFADASFSLIIHPCSNCFVPDVKRVWRECFRVLRRSGVLLAGFFNPIFYMLDREKDDAGEIDVKYSIPYSDLTSIDASERQRLIASKVKVPHFEFGHSLQDQIGGQLQAGFVLTDFLESRWTDSATTLNRYTSVYILTRALKS